MRAFEFEILRSSGYDNCRRFKYPSDKIKAKEARQIDQKLRNISPSIMEGADYGCILPKIFHTKVKRNCNGSLANARLPQ